MPVASEESEVDIEVEEMQYSSEEEDEGEGEGEGREDEEAGEDELEDSDNELADGQSRGMGGNVGPLKIKLKLGAGPQSEKPSSRRYARARNEDIESEDSDSEDSNGAYAPVPSSSRSRALTARQAALASAADPEYVALDTSAPGSSKKTRFTPSEVALRKEENARKRKNMIEKKLEDEKAETINRLLKKQSRSLKNKRNAAAPVDEDEDVDMEDGDDAASTMAAMTLPMYRWVSTSRRPVDDPMRAADRPVECESSISFSVPASFLPPPNSSEQQQPEIVIQMSAVTPARCAVSGCEKDRKYRAVGKAWGVGACGVGHLKILEAS
ncbi:hypothetical protein K438DRAFT_1795033 [Mycena galopus ATCC 62051]|nr:hypothetical protein K438DRAFT_1795033 [Mycena galopus ATCC 62051]